MIVSGGLGAVQSNHSIVVTSDSKPSFKSRHFGVAMMRSSYKPIVRWSCSNG
jgi:hypothetical protein